MTIDNLEIQIKSSSEQASQGINKLAASLTTLKQVAKGGAGLTSIANQLTKLNNALAGFDAPAGKIQSIVSSLNELSSVQKASGLSSVTGQLKKLPEITQSLQKADMDKFAKEIDKVTTAIRPLANEMDKVSRGFSALPTKIQKVIAQNEKLAMSNNKASKSYGILGTGIQGWAARLGTAVISARMIGNVIGGWIKKSNEYVENLNLFTVSLGEYADEAKDYAETVGELMGIDPSDWLRAQGIFNTLATGFGIAGDKAAIMSKNLTQLSYDLSSLYNIPVDTAIQNIQSAFGGELEPVRKRGFDLSQVRLQQIATEQGITKNFSEMNQAEKSMLRYYALMTQVTVAQGDMARTLNAPANQLRIFNAQLEQVKRSLGNVFIPALNAVLPYLIAFLRLIRLIADEIANFFGFKLPEIDYSSLDKMGSGAEENLNGASKAAKKLKNAVTGIDELNIISQDTGDTGDGTGGVGFDIDVPEYDFLKGLTESKATQIFENLKEDLDKIKGLVVGIGIGLLAWELSNGLLAGVGTLMSKFVAMLPMLATIVGFGLLVAGAFDAWSNGVDWGNLTLMLAGIALIVAGLGYQVGLIVGGITLLVVGIRDALINGINWENLTTILLGITAIVTVLALTFGLVAAAIGLVVGGVLLLVLGIRDLVMSGANSQNLTAIYIGLIAITVALTLAFGWIGLIIGVVVALIVSFVLFADKVMGALYVVGAFFKNVGLWCANLGLAIWEVLKNVGKFFGNVGSAIWEALKAVAHNVKTAFVTAWLNIKSGFLSFKEVVLSGVKAIADKANDLLGIFGVSIDVTGLEDQIQKIKDEKEAIKGELSEQEFKSIGEALKQGFDTYTYGSIEDAFNTFEVFDEGWSEEAWAAGEEVGGNFKDGIMEKLKTAFEGGTDIHVSSSDRTHGGAGFSFDTDQLSTGLDNSQMNTNLDELNTLQTESLSALNNTDTNITSLTELSTGEGLTTQKDQLSSLKDLDTHSVSNKNETITAIQNLSNYMAAKLDSVREACENIKINITKVYRSGADEYAAGGFPTTGQMFIANEAGPELVGRIGTKTAVANQDQITEGIAQAVYSAMMSANQSGGNQNINLFIDGKQVNAAVEKAKREKGTSIMTGGLIYG